MHLRGKPPPSSLGVVQVCCGSQTMLFATFANVSLRAELPVLKLLSSFEVSLKAMTIQTVTVSAANQSSKQDYKLPECLLEKKTT